MQQQTNHNPTALDVIRSYKLKRELQEIEHAARNAKQDRIRRDYAQRMELVAEIEKLVRHGKKRSHLREELQTLTTAALAREARL